MHNRWKHHEHSAKLLLHIVQQFSYNKVCVATANTILQNYNRDKAQPVLPLAILHFIQPSFQPWRNRKLATCRSCHRFSVSSQNPLVTLQPPSTAQPKNTEPRKPQEHKFATIICALLVSVHIWSLCCLLLNLISYIYELVASPNVKSIY